MSTHRWLGTTGGALGCAFLLATSGQAQVGIYGIGELAGAGENYSEVRAAILTSDGSIVAVGGANGQSWDTTANGGGGTSLDTAVLWSKGSGAGVLQALPAVVDPTIANVGRVVTAGDVTESSTGTISIAARSYYGDSHANAKEQVLYTYSIAGGTATYGATTALTPNVNATGQNAANAISRDGLVVYGFAQTAAGNVSTRWTSGTGLVSLGLSGTDVSNIPSGRGVSSDGSLMVGTTTLSDTTTTRAFIYNSGTSTYTSLGVLAGGTNSQALAISADGSKVFGTSESAAHPNGEAFFWTSGGGFTALGTPNDAWVPNILGGMTADGSAAIVDFDNGTTPNSYLFNSHGMFALESVLSSGGVDLTGWSNLQAQGISPDGRLIYGSGDFGGITEGFVAEVPAGLASAIPEPSADAMLGGLVSLGLVMRLRRRKA
ncbi:MAG TPA: hypothetical protein VHD61_11020 [Lacunisphaera sp.]|nr:hypothetical protein [Lacunisphaera sp.]